MFKPGLRILATVLIDGVVAGTWKIERRSKGATLTVIPFAAWQRPHGAPSRRKARRCWRSREPDAAVKDVKIRRVIIFMDIDHLRYNRPSLLRGGSDP